MAVGSYSQPCRHRERQRGAGITRKLEVNGMPKVPELMGGTIYVIYVMLCQFLPYRGNVYECTRPLMLCGLSSEFSTAHSRLTDIYRPRVTHGVHSLFLAIQLAVGHKPSTTDPCAGPDTRTPTGHFFRDWAGHETRVGGVRHPSSSGASPEIQPQTHTRSSS